MTVTAIYDMKKKKVGEVDLPDDVFNVPVKPALLHQMVCVQLSNIRQGNAKTKTRSEVRGGGKKPYRQKGTGRARHGSIRSPIFVGGGTTFGPNLRDWHISVPKQQRRVALKMALSQKSRDGNLFVVDHFVSKDGKTADITKALKEWNTKSSMIVSHEFDEKTIRATRNIPNVKVVIDRNLNVLDLFKYEHLLLTKDAIGGIVSRILGN